MPTTKTIAITGATGVMGSETVKEMLSRGNHFNLRLLVRPSKRNIKKMQKYAGLDNCTMIWGDLTNKSDVKKALEGADLVLHMGGMVSPLADHFPDKTMKVNVSAAENLVEAIRESPDPDAIGLVYIGSVAQTSCRHAPHHWGRTGDPIISAPFDYYSLSKILAERIIAESGLKHWVSLRQSGILHKGLVNKGSDPISFHVPLDGVLEWATVEDSARLMTAICETELPEHFWRNFYNIGSGKEFRLTNYEFEKLLMKSLGCPPPEKVFEPQWFAVRNFHGEWYEDSDKLEEMFHFRENIMAEKYFDRLSKQMPWWVKLAPLAPAALIKWGMKQVALTKGLGPLDWQRRSDCENRIKAFFKTREALESKKDWEDLPLARPSEKPISLSHGYNESKPDSELGIADMKQAAAFRGGECLSETMKEGDLDTPLQWRCAFGHTFEASPRVVLKGGHWCKECLPAPWRYDEEARVNPFLAQVWHDSHDPDENETYK